MDPLNLLREWTKAGKLDRIRLGPERVEFADSYSFRRDAPTSYKSQKGKGAFYGLATLLVFLRNSKTPFPQYVKITKEENVPTVSYLDRKVSLMRALHDAAGDNCTICSARAMLPCTV
jgi:Paf1 complex subunit CDC73 N-terminal